MLKRIKLLLGIAEDDKSKDELLNLLLDQALAYASNYTHRNDLLEVAPFTIINMVVQMYHNQQHNHSGIKQETYSSVSFTYTDDSTSFDANTLNDLKAIRKVRAWV